MHKTRLLQALIAIAVVSHQATSGSVQATGDEPASLQSTPSPALESEAGPEAKAKYPHGYIEEGPLPEGYPPPNEVGQVVEKCYPACRTYSAEGNNAFMRCFAYLNKQKHEMTAPVIMDYKHRDKPETSKPSPDFDETDVDRMHFILGSPSLDEPKREGAVVVADMPSVRVLSVAVQGPLSDKVLKESENRLADEISGRKDLRIVGPYRVLGYNSPFIARNKTFWEIQVPITRTAAEPDDNGQRNRGHD
jgi:hypothetical protein